MRQNCPKELSRFCPRVFIPSPPPDTPTPLPPILCSEMLFSWPAQEVGHRMASAFPPCAWGSACRRSEISLHPSPSPSPSLMPVFRKARPPQRLTFPLHVHGFSRGRTCSIRCSSQCMTRSGRPSRPQHRQGPAELAGRVSRGGQAGGDSNTLPALRGRAQPGNRGLGQHFCLGESCLPPQPTPPTPQPSP